MTDRIKEAEEAAKERFQVHRTANMFAVDWARIGYKAGYLAACEKCEGEIERLRKEIKIADNLIRTIPLPGRNNGAFGNNIYLPGYDEALGAYQKQFKTHNNEHGNKG